MERNFLNNEKDKPKLDDVDVDAGKSDVPPPKVTSQKRDEGNAEAAPKESPTDNDHIDSKITGQLAVLDLHSVPPFAKPVPKHYPKDKKRFVFRRWPRDPNGKELNSFRFAPGKEAGNGIELWGATLYDFFLIRGHPSDTDRSGWTISTGSKLAKTMKACGELEAAKDEIAWAEREEEPREILPCDPAEAINCYERRAQLGYYDAYSARKDVAERAKKSGTLGVPDSDEVEEMHEDNSTPKPVSPNNESGETPPKSTEDPTPAPYEKRAFRQLPADTPVDSPFHSMHYPSPWPFIPFENPTSPPALQRSLPIHLLPKILYVHDPWNLAVVIWGQEEEPEEEPFVPCTSKKDVVYTYSLSLPSEAKKAAEEASKAASAAEDEALKIPKAVLILPQQTEGHTDEPAIRAVLPQRPRKPTEVLEAHMYLSRVGKLGRGNHSIVYKAEWELPRDLFCESTICDECVREKVDEEVKRLKESGEWEQRLREAVSAYQNECNVSQEAAPSDAMKVVQSEPAPNAVPPKKGVGFIRVTMEVEPLEKTRQMVSPGELEHGEPPREDATPHYRAKLRNPVINRVQQYEGPTITIHPDVKWQNPSYPETICEHRKPDHKPVPRTARFLVAAKISLPHDDHLAREAQNYLKFPAHFFQYWNGYNIVPSLQDPTPIGPVVPQFFGYYVPFSGTCIWPNILSPIMLIEHCGKPVDILKLTLDDRQECEALLLRFHLAGWLHESFAPRNILVQEEHPTTSPLERTMNPTHKFRLIDFGRSRECTDSSERLIEVLSGKQMLINGKPLSDGYVRFLRGESVCIDALL
ncbi:hypothetical protein BDN67DRAFT_974822 [Paxillus ammoniavirescens]|nr:hypothetical protein BDN67DRAFT_974822 [Paxillus ammoniavirescens]